MMRRISIIAAGAIAAVMVFGPVSADVAGGTRVQGYAGGQPVPISAGSLPLPSGAAAEHSTAVSPNSCRLSDGAAFYDGAKTGQLPAALDGSGFLKVHEQGNASVVGAAASGATKSGNPVQTGAVFNTTQPTVTNGQAVENQATARGAQIVAPGVEGFAVTNTPPSNASTNVTQWAGTAVDVNSGTKSAGTIRVVLATDQPQLTNKLLVTPDSVALPANQSVNISQINGVTPLMGAGNTGTGSQRVTIASDQAPVDVQTDLSDFSTASSGLSTATALTQIVAVSGSNKIYILNWKCSSSAASTTTTDQQCTLKYGTGSNCATGTTYADGCFQTANGGCNGGQLVIPASQALCWIHAAAGSKIVTVTYKQLP